jgi:hypothetical protein
MKLLHFGEPGYSFEYADNASNDTVFQIYSVDNDNWVENAVNWNTLPKILENVSWTLVQPSFICKAAGDCWKSFDITQLVKADTNGFVSGLMYTGAGQYHSGKYFFSSEGDYQPVIEISYNAGTV